MTWGWRAAIALAVAAAAGVVSPPGRAGFGSSGFHLEEISAYTLRAEELKIGPTVIRYGLAGELQIGTHFALNLLGAVNADLKWRIFELPTFVIGAEVGIVHFDPGFVGVDTDFSVTALPVRLNMSFPLTSAWLVHARFTYQHARPDAQAPDVALRIQRHLGPVGRLAAELHVEWRVSDHLALVVDYAAPLVMLEEELRYASERSRGRMMRAAASVYGTFGAFSFRAGLGFGPSFLGEQGLFPVADLYWRIY